MAKEPTLWTRANDASSLSTPVIGGAGSDVGSPTFAYSAAKFGNGVSNTVAVTGKQYSGIAPDLNQGTIGCWVQYLNLTPANHTDATFWGCLGGFSAPSIAMSFRTVNNSFFITFHVTGGIYFYLLPTAADLGFSAAQQLQYIELTWDATGLTAGTAIDDTNLATYMQCYSTDSSGVLASRTLTNGTDTYAGGITFGSVQGAGGTATDLGIVGQNISGVAANAYVDNLKVWDYHRTLANARNTFLNERGGLNDDSMIL